MHGGEGDGKRGGRTGKGGWVPETGMNRQESVPHCIQPRDIVCLRFKHACVLPPCTPTCEEQTGGVFQAL